LKGILHTAGIADDISLLKSDWSKFESVFGPKVYGSWYLHLLTKELKLDFFVLYPLIHMFFLLLFIDPLVWFFFDKLNYSSIAASFGNAGQTNYSAANYFMDVLARYR
jgi:hypothetical protein